MPTESSRAWLRVRNFHHDISSFYSLDGQTWTRFSKAARKDQTDEVFGLFSMGEGSAVFRNFQYKGLE